MRKLIRPAEVNVPIQHKRTALHIASGYQRLNVVEYLLSSEVGADSNSLDEDGDGPLAHAVQVGNMAIVRLLLDHNANVNLINKHGVSALARSVINKRLEIMDVLLASGAFLDNQDVRGRTAVHFTVSESCPEALLKLVDKGADVNLKDSEHMTPLHLCGKFKCTQCCEILLKHGADPMIGDDTDISPLHAASALNAVDIMTVILDHAPMCIDCVDTERRTALHIACMAGQTSDDKGEDAALMLIALGASVLLKDANNYLPITYASKFGMLETVQALIARDERCATEPCGREQYTAIMAAVLQNRVGVVEVVLKESAGVDMNVADAEGHTALHLSALSDGVECAQLLLEHGAAVDKVNGIEQTPLHVAATKGCVNVMKVLLLHSTMTEHVINSPNLWGDTALHDAIACENESVARLLLTHGADFDIKNKDELTAVDISKLKSANIRTLMKSDAAALGAEVTSRRKLEGSDVVKRVRAEFPKGPQQCPELEVALFENFACLQDMQDYMLEISSDDQTVFCSELVKSLPNSIIRTKTKVISFLPRLIRELTSSSQTSLSVVDVAPAMLQREESFSQIHEINWDHLVVDAMEPSIVGIGSFGVVIRAKYAFQGKTSRPLDVAVKIMTPNLMQGEVTYQCIRDRAWAEADTIHRANTLIQSDSVIKLHGVVEGSPPPSWQTVLKYSSAGAEPVIGLVLKYEAGGSLETLLHGKVKRMIHMAEKVRILRGIALGLCDLHSLPIECYMVHGDIKPANVLLGSQTPCTVKLADFGISDIKESLMSTCQMSILRSTHTRRGTPVYSAPELLPSPTRVKVSTPSRCSDMYAFAVLAWELLTGIRPFQEVTSEMALCMTVHGGGRPDLMKLPSHTPPDVVEMIRACFDEDRSKRMTADECFVLLDHAHMCLSSCHFNIFFSHPWRDKSFLKHVFAILATAGYRVWYDVLEMKWDLDKSMSDGVKNSSVVIACVNTTYQNRPNCMKELNMAAAIDDPKKPIVCLVTESDPTVWATPELSALCSFQTNMYCDIGELAKLGETAWENPSEVMVSDLNKLLQPLFKILDELNIEKSLVTSP